MAMKFAALTCLFVAGLVAFAPGTHAAGDFVTISSNKLGFSTATCPNFVFSGYNTWQPIEGEAGILGPTGAVGPQFDAAVANGMNVVRMFGFSVQLFINNQYAPGVYNESMMVGFDNVIAEASKRSLKLIIALANNWDYNGNMSDCKCWYTNQSRTAKGCDDFFSDPDAIQFYLKNAQLVMSRVNTVTKLAYNNDPTIMAWDLINEGRCEANCTAAQVQAWTNQVAPLVKSYAPKQLLTVGQDGFWQPDNCASNTVNPVPNSDGWPAKTGQDFVPNHLVSGIDFTSIHMWPDNWDRTDLDFGKKWINGHLQQSRIMQKPLILEEFGKSGGGTVGNVVGQTPQDQQGYYKLAYAITEGSINAGDALRGIAFWRWDSINPSAQLLGFDQEATITTSGPVFQQIIKPFSGRMAKMCPTNTGAAAQATAGRRLAQAAVPTAVTTNPVAPVAAPGAATVTSGTGGNSIITGAACADNATVPGG